MEEALRKEAIASYQSGEKPRQIYTELKRSKKWFFKWLNRYKTGAAGWYKDKSKAPIKKPAQISERKKQRIVKIRKHLESISFAQVGVSAIKWELKKLGGSLPSDSTINRIIKSEGLIKKKLHTLPKEWNTRTFEKLSAPIIFIRQILSGLDTSKTTGAFILLT
ncbi:MAG: helix-turn-helix domain-containing protein [bacterium]|nr:helix-turn-helix domain-containing protein [bacterium]